MKCLLALTAIAVTGLAAAAPAAAALTGPEKQWVHSLTPLLTNMGTFSSEIAKDALDPTVFTRGSDTQMRLAVALAGYTACATTVARGGQPPTARLRPVRQAMASACGAYGRAANQLASGIDHMNVGSIQAAAASMRTGTAYIQQAKSLLLSLR